MSVPEEFVELTPEVRSHVETFLDQDDHSETLFNLVRAAIAAHEHSFHHPDTSKEAFLKFMSDAWDCGISQRAVYLMEKEGCINNEYGIASNFASSVALFGARNNLLP